MPLWGPDENSYNSRGAPAPTPAPAPPTTPAPAPAPSRRADAYSAEPPEEAEAPSPPAAGEEEQEEEDDEYVEGEDEYAAQVEDAFVKGVDGGIEQWIAASPEQRSHYRWDEKISAIGKMQEVQNPTQHPPISIFISTTTTA